VSHLARRQFAALATDDQHRAAVANVLGLRDEGPADEACPACGCVDSAPGTFALRAEHVCLPPAPSPVRKARRRR
jgi:hypothetical protein